MDVICVLPARLSSTRIPRKPLQDLAGRPLIEWTWRAASRASGFDRVVVATDAEEIAERARSFGADVVLTSPEHPSGTDRVEEAADRLGAAEDDVIVNFQADEPFVDVPTVERAVEVVRGERVVAEAGSPDAATLAAPIRSGEEWGSPGVVKVARAADGRALYFSRSGIPHERDGTPGFEGTGRGRAVTDRTLFLRHIGVYAYRRPALRHWASLPESPLERAERLEQLRALEAGMTIHVEVGPWTEPGIDLPADLARAESVLLEDGRRGSRRGAEGGA